ncbi:GAF domain-containing protein [Leptolyngbya sp. FACHB-541]|nr:GAF domain-containing protein [Leptolyngbya sp. FACHB-541]
MCLGDLRQIFASFFLVRPFFYRIHKLLTRRFQDPIQQNALLRRIVDRIRNSLELKVVLQTAVDEVATLLSLERCIFFWYVKDTQRVHVVCEQLLDGYASQLGNYPLSRFSSVAPLIEAGELVVSARSTSAPLGLASIANWLSPGHHHFTQSKLQILGAHANLLVPVQGRENSTGFIACLADRPRRWSKAEVDFMQSIAQQLEIAIRQAQLYEKTQKQARREQLVNQITTQTRQSLELETILTEAIAQLLDVLEIDRCLVHRVEDLEEDHKQSVTSPSSPLESDATVFRRKHLFEVCRPPLPASLDDFDTNGPITQWVIQHRRQVVISDIAQDARIGADNQEYQLAQIKSSLVVPVQANGTLQAILYLNQCSHIRYWSRDDQKLAQAVADQLAISIQQGHLYAQTQQQAIASAAQAEHLASLLHDLQQTQAQLIQSEKMSSLGQLVAGVAHEINNPVSFIYGNIPYIERYIKDLLRLLSHYQTRYPEADSSLQDLAREIELDFLLQDMPRILGSIRAGATRIREVVLSLRSFSRLDEAHCKIADLQAGLDSTLFVLQNHIRSDIQVVRQYGDVPAVECYPRLLNQVFMNLLINAVEALHQDQAEPKTIVIRIESFLDELTGKWVRIAIADNGCGIPYEFQPRIFDPFFTTKQIGHGVGLGLTVSYQTVVNQHQGHLRFHSQPDNGSEFIIEIPVKHSASLVRTRNLYLPTQSDQSNTGERLTSAIQNTH